MLGLRRALALITVLAATCAGSYLALVGYHAEHTLSIGEIRESVSPGHRGALDVYVPLLDWGVRFEAVTLPVRLRVDLQTVNRTVAADVAGGGPLNVQQVRDQARGALTAYLERLIALMVLCGAGLGVLTAFAIRSRALPAALHDRARGDHGCSPSASPRRCSSRPAAGSTTRSTTPTAPTSPRR